MPITKSGFQSQKNSTQDSRKRLGSLGERLAEDFFQCQGFLILERNWRCRYGELDLVVQKGSQIRFIEVKTRKTITFGYPEEAVTKAKLSHLFKAGELWLGLHDLSASDWQLDVLAIQLPIQGSPDYYWLQGVA